jgi:hypothetical protein
MMLWLSFGGAPCPLEWGAISESICNLINAILRHDYWNPLSLYATDAQEHVPPKEFLPDDVPFGISSHLIIEIQINTRGIVNVYIDHFIGLTVDIEDANNATRLERAPLLGLTAVSHKVSPIEPLPCGDMDAWEKLKAKTGLTEITVILGWLLNFRSRAIVLPKNKYITYSRVILDMLNCGWTSKGELKMNIGRWVHLGQIIPLINHFLSRLSFLLRHLEKKRKVEINKQCKADLHFLQFTLKKCLDGVDLTQLLSVAPPTRIDQIHAPPV